MSDLRPARWRNIAIFAAVTLVAGNFFGLNFHAANGLGGLLFILTPTLAALGLRAFGGDGWGDAGFGLRLRRDLGWYLAALGLFPALTALVLAVGTLAGAVDFQPGAAPSMATAMLTGLASISLFALLEEIGWRGYLDPRLAALGLKGWRRHGLVALIWGLWHGGYILAQPDAYGHLPFVPMLALSLVGTAAMAVIYGVMRAATASLWPAVIAHAVANLLAWPLIDPKIVTIAPAQVFAARPDGLVYLAVLIAAALWFYRQGAKG